MMINSIFYHRFSFPSIFIVYMTCDTLVQGKYYGEESNLIPFLCMYAGFFVLVTYMDHSSLYCSSPNLLDSLLEVTSFCVITGKC